MLLHDKVCIITGAASLRGIGYATAELFAEHGARTVVADLAMDETVVADIQTSIGMKVPGPIDLHGVRCDIGSFDDCRTLFEDAIGRFGRVDCLINCAAVVKSQSFLSITEEDYDFVVDVNLKGAFNLGKVAVEHFVANKGGNIVNVASVAAQRGGGLVGGAHYAASKGGVISLTKSIAREYGPKGVRANVICPSMTETGMLDGMTEEKFQEIVSAIPMRRAGKPRDIAGACLFLASDLSAYITGTTIDVNGGSHIH
ncbi:MAG: SDR family NAD(P)-dependent oxidoreductase [Reyranella sp.]|uniref:SDR family NAD(P)-dependent oxidoreductase n=1 Tax=Reyranella sp. TaxID=1929291 RepID=UPI00273046EB|nr:SDR family NAD(P)-dependent oxidoreductase [Reyranella sp.]MDP1962144.1 SDR family NAD(P)-dependent oxidoreductase [Reyranella sp.]MDP2376717.1 SDR family NAD(P)-dependent oxidoreductase [Reyranella sp.]